MILAFFMGSAAFAQECSNYKLYYTHEAAGDNGYALIEVELSDGIASLNVLQENIGEAHIALSPDGGFIYVLGTDLRIYDVALGTLSAPISIQTADGASLTGFPSAVCDANGVLYGGHSGTDQVYTIDLDGTATAFGPSVDVNGGDLIFAGEDLWTINRGTNVFTKVLTGETFSVDVNEINGAAVLANGNVIVADGNGQGLFKEIDLSDASVVAEYESDLALNNGDFAGGCLDNNPDGSACEDFSIFYANHGPGINGTDIYNVEISGGMAELSLENNLPYEAHIAYQEDAALLLLVNANGNFVDFYDPSTASIEAQLSLEEGLNQLYAVVYNANDGKLYVGDAGANEIYAIDLSDGSYEFIAEAPIEGGDLVLIDGELYVATREGDELRKVVGNTTEFVQNIPAEVNGASADANGNILLSNFASSVFTIVDADGNEIETLEISLGGEPFTANNGDLAGGCNDSGGEVVCLEYAVYLINNPEQGGSTLYKVNIAGGSATLEVEAEFEHGAHIALGNEGQIYLVAALQGKYSVYDPSSNTLSAPIQITFNGDPVNGTPQAVVDPATGDLYVASVVDGAVYQVDPTTGEAELFALTEVSGGDLVFTQDGDLWITNRFNDVFFNLTDGTSSFEPGLSDINGAAVLEDGTIIVSNAGSTELNLIDPATGMLMDMSYEIDVLLENGDMAAGCVGGFTVIEECDDFRYFYIADNTPGFAQGTVFEGAVEDGEFVLTQLFETNLVAHLAVNTDNGSFYVVNGSVLRTYSYSGALINEVSTSSIGGITAAVYNPADGLVYVGDASDDEIWTVDAITGDASLVAEDVPVQGGDLFLDELGELYLIERNNDSPSKLYRIEDGTAVEVADLINSINGGARSADGGLIVAEGDNSNSFYLYDIDGGNEMMLAAVLDGDAFPVVDGDMASGCFDNTEFFEPQEAVVAAENVPALFNTFPNPTQGISNINFEVMHDGFTSIELVDLNGITQQVVFSQEAFTGQKYSLQIQAADLPDGIYIYKLTTNEGVVTKKLMINKN
ncbi:MAG: T9SS type A sorting domain-containing protein [Cryomorphaceae bacterium]